MVYRGFKCGESDPDLVEMFQDEEIRKNYSEYIKKACRHYYPVFKNQGNEAPLPQIPEIKARPKGRLVKIG